MKNGIKNLFYKLCFKPRSFVQIIQQTTKENIVSHQHFKTVIPIKDFKFMFRFESELKSFNLNELEISKENQSVILKSKTKKLILINIFAL
jgi:hypothetical protein